MPTDSEHAPVTERYPELADIDEQDNDRKLETYRNVLESLQHELVITAAASRGDSFSRQRKMT